MSNTDASTEGYDQLLPDGRVFIGGKWRDTAGTFADIDPHTERPFAEAPDGDVSDMDAAIAAARAAADGDWPHTSLERRAAALGQLAEALDRHADEFAALGRHEWAMTANERGYHIDAAGYYATDTAAQLPAAFAEEPLGRPDWGMHGYAMREPLGVIGAITAWNFPHTLNLQKLSPALAAGNALVLKPSPLSPLAALALAKVVNEETDIPDGVVNVVTTTSPDAAELLTTDPRVDMVTFVGSAATARVVGAAAAGTIKRTLFELGGKSAALFLDDFDVSSLGPQTLLDSCTLHAGQACLLHSRLLVHRSLYDDFVNRFAEMAGAVKVGDPSDPSSEMGPLINDEARERVLGFIERAVDDGAEVVTGGGRPAGLDTGYYVEPTVLVGVHNDMEIAREEVFGPVTCIIPFADDDEAVQLANDSQYGLVGTVHSGSHDRGLGIARRIKAGVVTLDGAPPYGYFGGFKQSGVGREGGVEGIRSYTELRSVTYMG